MRKLRSDELIFITRLLDRCHCSPRLADQLSKAAVADMNDGGMGSLSFLSSKADRVLGEDVARLEFADEDGVCVVATLSVDNFGDFFELDVWKTDFSELRRFPCE